jgi:hypothetical protein
MFFWLLGLRGRPRKFISTSQIGVLYRLGFSATKMAKMFACSRRLIHMRLSACGLRLNNRYSTIPDDELDQQISAIVTTRPLSGIKVCIIVCA